MGSKCPRTRASTLSNDTRGRKGTYLKLGSRYAEVVCSSSRLDLEGGKEELATATL